MSTHIRGGGKAIGGLIGDLPEIYDKNPVVAGILGFFFGGLGLGLYFRSWKDFVYPLVIFIISVMIWGSFIMPIIGVFPGWLFGSTLAAGWGVWRASGGGG